MTLYEKRDIEISVIEDQDKTKVLKYFQENDFNCDYESGALRPSDSQFVKIMDEIISKKDNSSSIFVLKKKGEVIGYISMYVEYDRLHIGHIAVDKKERGKGYGTLMTKLAMAVAENEGRDVSLYCSKPNNCFDKLPFKKLDNVHYLYERKNKKKDKSLPQIFISVEDYKKKRDKELQKEVDNFSKFLNSNIFDIMKDL